VSRLWTNFALFDNEFHRHAFLFADRDPRAEPAVNMNDRETVAMDRGPEAFAFVTYCTTSTRANTQKPILCGIESRDSVC
jgi:hypothetical protein